MSDWSLPIEATHWLRDHIEHGSWILELGSGEGTFRLAEWFHVVTIEHDNEWFERGKRVRDSKHCVSFAHAPIVDGWYDARALQGMLGQLVGEASYAAVVVDGPPGSIGRWGFAAHLDLFRDDVPILLDDVHRSAERELAQVVATKLDRSLSMHMLTDGRAFGVVGKI